MASRKELLDSIKPDMKSTKSFFIKIYGYELTWPGFAEDALNRLEEAGSSKAREHYAHVIAEYEQQHETEMKEVASWYRKWLDQEFEKDKRKVVKEWKEDLAKMSSSDLLTYLENLAKKV